MFLRTGSDQQQQSRGSSPAREDIDREASVDSGVSGGGSGGGGGGVGGGGSAGGRPTRTASSRSLGAAIGVSGVQLAGGDNSQRPRRHSLVGSELSLSGSGALGGFGGRLVCICMYGVLNVVLRG